MLKSQNPIIETIRLRGKKITISSLQFRLITNNSINHEEKHTGILIIILLYVLYLGKMWVIQNDLSYLSNSEKDGKTSRKFKQYIDSLSFYFFHF